MNKNRLLTTLLLLFAMVLGAQAQNCDPWIVSAYKELYNRTPTATECNIKNYNNGSWGSYSELVGHIKNYNARAASTGNTTAATPQNCDPWIVKAYQELYRRNPTAQECNIRNYNNGSWGSYNELAGHIRNYQNRVSGSEAATTSKAVSSSQLKGDPWIFKAYEELYRRQPNAWELNVKNYNNGSWSSYNDLKNYIREYQSSTRKQGFTVETADLGNNNILVGFYLNGKQVAVNMVSANGGGVVAAGGANVVSAGGGNVVAAGGGNVVSAGGGNVVSAGGGNVVAAGGANVVSAGGANILVNTSMAGVNFGGGYRTLSQGSKVITTSGRGSLVIR